MRSLSLLALLSGCALVDATGDADQAFALSYTPATINGFNNPPLRALVYDGDGNRGPDLAILGGDRELYIALTQSVDPTQIQLERRSIGPTTGPYDAIAVGDLDGVAPDEVAAAGIDRLDVFTRDSAAPVGAGVVVPGARPITLAIGTFPFLANPGHALALGYSDANLVKVVANTLGSPATRTITLENPPVSLTIANTDSRSDVPELLIAEQHDLIEAVEQGSDFASNMHTLNGTQFTLLASGQLGGDEAEDLAFGRGEGGVGIAFGRATGLDETIAAVLGDAALQARAIEVGDLDGDLRDDLVVLTASDPPVLHLFRQVASGQFAEQVVAVEGVPTSLSIGDLDGDGRADLVLVPGHDGGVDLLLSN